ASQVPLQLPLPGGGHVVPDGVFGLEYRLPDRSAYRFFALEVDRGTMPVLRRENSSSSYLSKLSAYRTLIDTRAFKSHLGISTFLPLSCATELHPDHTKRHSCVTYESRILAQAFCLNRAI